MSNADRYQSSVALYSSGKFSEALQALGPLLRSNPTIPKATRVAALNLAAICSLNLHRVADAETYWQRAIKEQPDYADAYNNLAIVFMQGGRLPEAEKVCRQALAVRPDYAEAHNTLGNVLLNLNRLAEAETACRQAVTIRPDYLQAHFSLGNILYGLRRLADAQAAYHRVIELHPAHAEALSNLGNVLSDLNRLPEAVDAYQRALAINPGYAEIHSNLAKVLRQLKRLPEAEAACARAIALRPALAEAHFNLGNVLADLDRPAEAEACFRRALEHRPGYAEAHNNLGSTLYDLRRLPEAERAYRQAMVIRADYADPQVGLAGLLLSIGRFPEGWRYYEARYATGITHRNTIPPDVRYPQWQGEALDGKSLLVWYEQGYGDMIQFGRYLQLLKAQRAQRITLAAPVALHRLFAELDYLDAVVDGNEALAGHDFWTWLLSTPLHCGTTVESIPSPVYLKPRATLVERWRERLAQLSGKKIGLVWKGSAAQQNDRYRSLPSLATLAPLWDAPGISFVSLQKGPGEDEVASLSARQPMLHLGGEIADFADTAAIVAQLDLVICVDTAIAHLAGSLGKPCWVLLPAKGVDWRWMHESMHTPWYPGTVRLFRQSVPGDWAPTVERVQKACVEGLPTGFQTC